MTAVGGAGQSRGATAQFLARVRGRCLEFLSATWVGLLALCVPMGIATAIIAFPRAKCFAWVGVFQEFHGGEIRTNVVLLLLMLASQITLCIMLFWYIVENHRSAIDYKGRDLRVSQLGVAVAVVTLLVLFALGMYMGMVVQMFRGRYSGSLSELFELGRSVLLVTFSAFLLLDGLLWGAAGRAIAEAHRTIEAARDDDAKKAAQATAHDAENDRDLARLALLLIDLPVLLVALGALGLRLLMQHASGYYDVIVDTAFVSCGVDGISDPARAELFGNGVEAGVTIGLMVFSQIEFAVLKGRWALRRKS